MEVMRQPALALILASCVDAVVRGADPELVAETYPVLKPTLMPMLDLATDLSASKADYSPPAEFLAELRARLLQA